MLSIFQMWHSFISFYTSAGLMVGLGVKLLLLLREFRVLILNNVLEDKLCYRKDMNNLLFMGLENAIKLKESFRLYSRIFGILGGVLLLYGGIAFGYSVYCYIWPRDASSGLAFVLTMGFLVISVVSIGNSMKDEVETTRQAFLRTIWTLKMESANKEFLMTLISVMTFIVELEISETKEKI
ncbi:unnamed protein product [Allacma fusca]|uniref:Uncharacterized protein n=1 Tax=Allacma fusca TaxID=39272 RepID=A0A8J2JE25_9HEXA|nr:unnamed protein product [Allacma fusca]